MTPELEAVTGYGVSWQVGNCHGAYDFFGLCVTSRCGLCVMVLVVHVDLLGCVLC